MTLAELTVPAQFAWPVSLTRSPQQFGFTDSDDGNVHAVAWGDYDGDGLPDMYITMRNGTNNVLLHNLGNGSFQRINGIPPVQDSSDSLSAEWADFNNDGGLDLVVANHNQQNNLLFENTASGFVSKSAGLLTGTASDSLLAAWSDVDRDGFVDLLIVGEFGTATTLYRNAGGTAFSALWSPPASFQAAAWADLDGDGDQDLALVVNQGAIRLYRNDNGVFSAVTEIGDARQKHGSAIAFGDIDNDGDMDLVMGNYGNLGIYLYRNDGNFNFVPISGGDLANSGLITTFLGLAWADLNNDGNLDLLVADDEGQLRLYLGNGFGGFIGMGLLDPVQRPISVHTADFNRDGMVDFFVTSESATQSSLYINQPNGAKWLECKLRGQYSNASAFGARVEVRAHIAGTGVWQTREIAGGNGFRGQDDLVQHFGLGDATNIDIVRVYWPSGKTTTLQSVTPNQLLTIDEVADGYPVVRVNGVYSLDNWFGMTNDLPVTVTIQSTYPNVFYSTNGPADSSSTPYTGSFSVKPPATIYAATYTELFDEGPTAGPVEITRVPTFTLTDVTPGGGQVTMDPPGGSYLSNMVVTLKATASPGWTFMRWESGDEFHSVIGNNPNLVWQIQNDLRVVAVFGTTLEARPTTSAFKQPQVTYHPYGSDVLIWQTPASDKYFARWALAGSSSLLYTNSPYAFKVTTPTNIYTAVYNNLNGNRSLTLIYDGAGSVTREPALQFYTNNATVTLTAIPADGWQFINWTEDASTTNPRDVVMNANRQFTAKFSKRPFVKIYQPSTNKIVDGSITNNISAGVTLSEGNVARVDFYDNGVLIGQATDVLTVPWKPESEGTHNLVAIAYTSLGTSGTSQTVTVTVGFSPTFTRTLRSQILPEGFNARWEPRVAGTLPMTAIYVHNGTNFSTSSDYTYYDFGRARPEIAGTYFLTLSNAVGTVSSDPLELTVVEPGNQLTVTPFTPGTSLLGAGVSVAYDGTLYIPTQTGLWAGGFDGSKKWTFDADVRHAPCVAPDGTVIFADAGSGTIWALDPETGLEKWHAALSSTLGGGAIASDGTIYFGSDDYKLTALRPANGAIKWQYGGVAAITGTPTIGVDGTIFVIDSSNNLYAVAPDGSERWKNFLGDDVRGQPTPTADGGIIVSLGVTGLISYNGATGGQRWFNADIPAFYTPSIGSDGTIYVGAETLVYAVNPKNGGSKWEREAGVSGGAVVSQVSVGANGYIYVATTNANGGFMRVLDANGATIKTNVLDSVDPGPLTLTADSLLYFNANSVVPFVAYSGPADSPWPTHRKSPTAHGNAAGLPGDLKWRWVAAADVSSSPAIDPQGRVWFVDNNIFLGVKDGTLSAQGPFSGGSVTPVIATNGWIYQALITSYFPNPIQSRVSVYDPKNQTEIYSQTITGYVGGLSQLAVNAEGKAFISAHDTQGTGNLLTWKQGEGLSELATFPADGIGAPVLVEDGVFVPAGHLLHKISYSGSIMGSYDVISPDDLEAYIIGGPAVGESGQIYISTQFGGLHALDSGLGVHWVQRHLGERIDTAPIVGPDGTVYLAIYGPPPSGASDTVYHVQAFDQNGNLKWDNPIALDLNYGISSPAIAQDKTIYVAGGRTFWAIRDADDHADLVWRFSAESEITFSSPVIDGNGTVYVGSDGGSLYSLHGSVPPSGGWPMFRGNAARTGNTAPLNLPPSITITNPLSTAVLYAPAHITIKVDAHDPDGSITGVEYLDNDLSIGSSSNPPFDFATTLAAGAHVLKARATDNGGAQTVSPAVNLTVNPPAKPVIQLLAPSSTDPFKAPTNIVILAQATDADGTITRVDFFSDIGPLGSVAGPTSSNRYSLTWTNPPAGSRIIFARAYDNDSTFTDSSTLNVTVAQPAITTFRFANAAYTFPENAGQTNIVVVKSGATAATVNYATQLITAEPDRDYVTVQGTLSFAANETVKNVPITLLNEYIVDGDKSFEVRLSSPTGGAQLSDPSVTTVTIQDDDAALANASLIDFRLSASRPSPAGSLQVHLLPSQAAWRFPWEFGWRAPEAIAPDLDPGSYPIEFRPTLDYITPDVKTNSVPGGPLTEVFYSYTSGGSGQSGSVSVYFENFAKLSQAGVPQWRLDGDGGHKHGDVVGPLPTGIHVIEFTDLTGWITPSPREVLVQASVAASIPVTYQQEPPRPSGVELPSPLTYTAVRAGQIATVNRQPYPMVGQIQSPAGFGSGTAVRDRVVLTAAHVLFDDTTTNFVNPAKVAWFPERVAGEYEPKPLYPAGFYVHTNYLVQRTLERKTMAPGEASAASQQWDIAALYFNEPVARGGQTGYLLSDASTNEWLIGSRLKQLIGYPLFDVNRGRMHDIRPLGYLFTFETNGLFLSPQFLSYPGNSGGPVWSLYSSDQGYFPAGVYLGSRISGGRTNSVVRAIDSMAALLINRAQSSAELGLNFAGGGADRFDSTSFGAFIPGTLYVVLEPAAANAVGAGWHVVGSTSTSFRASGEFLVSPTADITLEFAAATGYLTPTNRTVKVIGNQTNTVTIAYTNNLSLGGIALGLDNKLRFSISTTGTYVIESTIALGSQPNLTSWTPVSTNTGPFTFESLVSASEQKRYYRARLQGN